MPCFSYYFHDKYQTSDTTTLAVIVGLRLCAMSKKEEKHYSPSRFIFALNTLQHFPYICRNIRTQLSYFAALCYYIVVVHVFDAADLKMEGKRKILKISSRTMVEGALCVALSVALSMFKLFKMPQGGSVSLTTLPLLVFALRNGCFAGASAGFTAGIIRLFLGAYIVHPLQALLDYPAALAAIGLAGIFQSNIYLGVVTGMAGCLISYALSGVIFFASYAPEGTNALLYSIIYNATFLVPEMLIDIILIRLLWSRLRKIAN